MVRWFRLFDWFTWSRLWGARFLVMLLAAAAVLAWFWHTDPAGGADTKLRLQFLAWACVCSGPAYLIYRALGGEGRAHEAWNKAILQNSVAGAVLWLGTALLKAIIFLALVLLCTSSVRAASGPPDAAKPYLQIMRGELRGYWPDMPDAPTLAAQVEQETCVSLRSTRCWSPHAELKTPREYGFGLGQLTVTHAFDNFAAARRLDPSLNGWKWEERYDAARQLRTLVLMDRSLWRAIYVVPDAHERLAMMLAAYNGGLGGIRNDRRLCAQAPGCDPARWYGHVETHSLKARAAQAGYGRSFFDINRAYPRAIQGERRERYVLVEF